MFRAMGARRRVKTKVGMYGVVKQLANCSSAHALGLQTYKGTMVVEAGSTDPTFRAVTCSSGFPSTIACPFPASIDHH